MLTQIYDLAYEVDEDGSVQLEQSAGCGEVSRITLHPVHVRLLAEEAGLLAPSSNIEADRTIARLCRQMRILHSRIDELDDWINAAAQRGHEDLEAETVYSLATWELATEFLAELPDRGNVWHTERQGANDPKSGTVATGNPPKSGGIPRRNTPKSGAVTQAALKLDEGRA